MQASGKDGGAARRSHWRRVRRASALLVALWATVTLLPWVTATWPARAGAYPIGYWAVAQGALLAFLGIVVGYALWTERLDARYRRERAAQEGQSLG